MPGAMGRRWKPAELAVPPPLECPKDEMAALAAGDKELPILRLPASAVLAQVKAHRERAKPLPGIARGYRAVLFYPVVEEADWKHVTDPPVDQPLPSLVNEVETLWEGVLLAGAFAAQVPKDAREVELHRLAAIAMIRARWKRLGQAERRRVDDFSVRIMRVPLSEKLGLESGTEP